MTAEDVIKEAEGLRLSVYDDATGSIVGLDDPCEGTMTIGWGHTGPDVYPGQRITEEQAEAMFQKDFARATQDAILAAGTLAWNRLDPVRQAVLIDMAFNLGLAGLIKFTKMLQYVRNGVWQKAHDEILNSKAYMQEPVRVTRNAGMMLTGQWP